jgi:hypothetical protein
MMRHRFPLAAVCLALATLFASPAHARQHSFAIDAAAGWVGFADDGIVSEGLFGGAARWQISPRVGIGPELVYIQGENHSHVVVTGNLTFDFNPDGAVQPFIVVGGGMFQTHETFFGDAVTSSEGAFTVGGGVRRRVSDRVGLGIDVRLGWETHLRVGGIISVRLGS